MADADGLRVLTWNLWWRFGAWQDRQTAIEAELAAARPDVCALQEVWIGPEGDQAELLAGRLGMHAVLAPSPAPGRWQRRLGDPAIGFANAVLSRWPITRSAVHELPAHPGEDGERTVLHAEIAAPGGTVDVFTTQLDSAPDRSATRCAQVEEVVRFVAARAGTAHPPVVTGGLNAEPDSDEIRRLCGHKTAPVVPGTVLVDAWRYAGPGEAGWTWDRRNPHVAATFEPSARIDYVLVGPPTAGGRGHVRGVRLVGDRPVDGVWPSDHCGVLAELGGAR
jgi:endonuclease/exonuclease/phosphatase family metal-dependent hydrolase